MYDKARTMSDTNLKKPAKAPRETSGYVKSGHDIVMIVLKMYHSLFQGGRIRHRDAGDGRCGGGGNTPGGYVLADVGRAAQR